ncbi:ubiquinone anaerobic biosynthesis protein UbiV [Bradyrhizobium sp.]|uniref:ubiquinone anaerobic biosynthesis protein UbiV n=1 Tax=Bradyrhizobium sp. TaxID=376 RepID=UPI003C631B91
MQRQIQEQAQARASELTLGPVLFNWEPERWRDFYFGIADEAPVTTVYLGEAICFKRAPLFRDHVDAVAERLAAAGKTVVRSTLSEVMSAQERSLVAEVCAEPAVMVEANDGSALLHLRGRPHHVGPFINVYNERTMAVLARGGACAICLPPEMPAEAIAALCIEAATLGVTIETQVFGRLSLALSARCYHARAHDRNKDSCQFICKQDPDGLTLRTLEDQPFLVINGIQTMSYDYLNLIGELADLQRIGVRRFRLSPHSCDMVAVAATFRDVLDERIDAGEATQRLDALGIAAPFSNGFYHGKAGHLWN